MKRIFGGINYRDVQPIFDVNDTKAYIYNSLHSSTARLSTSKSVPIGHCCFLKINKGSGKHFYVINDYFDPLGNKPRYIKVIYTFMETDTDIIL